MRKTKIVCTIRPASESEETLKELCLAGMNFARLNFSHGTHEEHLERIRRIKKVREELGLTTNEKTWRSLALSWAVTPMMCEVVPSTEVLFYMAKKAAEEAMDLKKGEKIVITRGGTTGKSGNTNLIKIETI